MRWLKKALGKTGRKAAEDACTKGYVAAREGRLDAAQKLYEEAIDADPTLAVAYFNAGQTALERYNRDAAGLDAAAKTARLTIAVTHLEAGIDVDDSHAPSWRALARVLERLGRIDAAQVAWGRVEQALGEPTDAESTGQGGDIAAARAEARREWTRLKPTAELTRALAAARQRIGASGPAGADDDEAAAAAAAIDTLLACADAARDVDGAGPALQLVHTVAGALARTAGDPRARELLDAAVTARADDIDAWRNLATVCLSAGDLKAALRASAAAYRLDPVDAGLVCNLGVCHLASAEAGHGTIAQAREYIELAAQLAPKDPIVLRAMTALREAESARPA